MDLQKDYHEFIEEKKKISLPGFMDRATDEYATEDFNTVADEMFFLVDEMKSAITANDSKHFFHCRDKWEEHFENINTAIANKVFLDLTNKLVNDGMEEQEARMNACAHLWNDPRMRYWLPTQARLKDGKGRTVWLVGDERHIPQEGNYVTLSEIEYLKSSGLDPWAFVENRKGA